MLDGVTVRPAFALGRWIAFKPMGGEAMVMGDLVLLEAEVSPVMAKLIENGIEITARAQSPAASPSGAVLHARRRTGDAGQVGDGHSRCPGGKQNAVGSASAAVPRLPSSLMASSSTKSSG